MPGLNDELPPREPAEQPAPGGATEARQVLTDDLSLIGSTAPADSGSGVWHGIVRVVRAISFVLAVLGAAAVVAIMLFTVADVINRSITGGSLAGVTEYSEVLLVAAVFLALPMAQFLGTHVGVDLLVERLRPRAGRILHSLGLVVVLVALAWMTWATATQAMHSFEVKEYRFGIAEVPVWPARIAIPVGLGMWWIVLLLHLIRPLHRPVVDAESHTAEGGGV